MSQTITPYLWRKPSTPATPTPAPAPAPRPVPPPPTGDPLADWGSMVDAQTNSSPGLKGLRSIGGSLGSMSMPSMPHIPFNSSDLKSPSFSMPHMYDPSNPPDWTQDIPAVNRPQQAPLSGGHSSGDIELPPAPKFDFPDNPSSMVSLDQSPYRQQANAPQNFAEPKRDVGAALAGLKSNAAVPYKPGIDSSQSDTNSQLYQLQNQRANEFSDRINADKRAATMFGPGMTKDIQGLGPANYSGDASALQDLLSTERDDIADNPISKQLVQSHELEDKNRSAIMAGYGGAPVDRFGPSSYGSPNQGSPVQRQAQAQTGMEMEKIGMPAKVAGITGAASVQAAQERGRVYEGRTLMMQAKALEDNAARIKVAMINSGNRVAAAAVDDVVREKSRLMESIDRGLVQEDDPSTIAHMKFLSDQLDHLERGDQQPGGQPPPQAGGLPHSDEFAKQISTRYPGKTAGEILADLDSQGGFATPADRQALLTSLNNLGIR